MLQLWRIGTLVDELVCLVTPGKKVLPWFRGESTVKASPVAFEGGYCLSGRSQ